MWSLIPKRERKLYRLIDSLYHADNTMTLEELSLAVDASKRSVSNYIDDLKNRVENSGGSLLSLMGGYQLMLPENINIDEFQHQAIQSSLAFEILEKLLFKDKMKGFELEKELHISSSSLSRIINQLKDCLGQYGLTIEVHPYRIAGDEFLIRRFYTSYFLEGYGYNNWPFPSIDINEINRLVESLAKIKSIRFETVNVQKFILFTAVSIIREQFNHDIYQSKLSEGRYDGDNFKHMRNHVYSWLNTLDMPSDKKELYTRIYTFYMFIYFRSYTKKSVSLNYPDFSTLILSSLNTVAHQFRLPAIDFNHIAHKIDDLLYHYVKTDYAKALDSFLVFKPRDYSLLKLYSRQYPSFIQKLIDILDELYKLYDIDPQKINTDELLYLIISRWDQLSLHLYKNYTSCRLLVYSPLGYRHADNIAELLRVKLENTCTVSVFSEPNLTTDSLKKYTFDILVSSSSLQLNIEQPIIALHNKYSGYHLQPLLNAIDKAVKVNRQKLQDESGF